MERRRRSGARRLGGVVLGGLAMVAGFVPALAGTADVATSAGWPLAGPALVFDGVMVVDVERDRLLPRQRVVITGNRITAVGSQRAVPLPKGAQVVDARGKYLIPGLWDLHVHPRDDAPWLYPLFLANGVTGIRDPGSDMPLDTLRRWRREILSGARMGPPRHVLSGKAIDECSGQNVFPTHTCVVPGDSAHARRVVDSLKAAGADMLKMYSLSRAMYFAIAAEARRLGIPFGGHLDFSTSEASDSGARIIDHINVRNDLTVRCFHRDSASVERCRPVAEQFRRNGTWVVPTLTVAMGGGGRALPVVRRLAEFGNAFWPDSFAGSTAAARAKSITEFFTSRESDTIGFLEVAHRVGLPILAGTDAASLKSPMSFLLAIQPPGFSLHAELAMYVAEGLTPLEALQTATLNPAKFLRGTDSLGTVAAGKLADLVLLDADPLADIANTARIRAVVANGRYFDRGVLDRLLAEVRVKANEKSRAP